MFFFFRQKTAYEMRISDWSSDVCSSDLAQVDLAAPGAVIELGGGTGNVTAALLEAGVPPQDIAVVERDPVFARVIAARFPQVRVLQGDASELRRLLREAGIGPVRSEEHTSELQSLMRSSYAVFCLKKKKQMSEDK